MTPTPTERRDSHAAGIVDTEAKIAALKTKPPTVKLSKWARVERVVAWITAAIAVASLVIGVVNIERVSKQANCINANLGVRSAPGNQDAVAHIAFGKAVQSALKAHPVTAAQQAAETRLVNAQVDRYVSTLTTDQKIRLLNPLGHC